MGNTLSEPAILAVETSSRLGSVALARGEHMVAEVTFSAPLRHSAEIFPAIGRLLDRFEYRPTDITQVHISIGPGSFTGLRIAVTLAKAMHMANGTAIVTVGSLDTIAANLMDGSPGSPMQNTGEDSSDLDRIAVLIDAKRGQFYVAAYERRGSDRADSADPLAGRADYRIPAPGGGTWRKTLADCLMTAPEFVAQFAQPDRPIHVLGDGLLYHRDRFASPGIRIIDPSYWSPRAAHVHALGRQKARAGHFADPLSVGPLYLRGPQVTLKRERG